MRAATVTDFRANIATMLDRVADDHMPLIVTRQGGRNVVIISEEDWNKIDETMYLLASPANAKNLLESIAELNAGKGEFHELIEE